MVRGPSFEAEQLLEPGPIASVLAEESAEAQIGICLAFALSILLPPGGRVMATGWKFTTEQCFHAPEKDLEHGIEGVSAGAVTGTQIIFLDAREQRPNAIWLGTNVPREALQKLLDHERNSISMEP